jgi:preprotein translocase subunit SecF
MIDLIGKKYYFFALSGLLILAGLVGLLVNGIKLDIQFQGGTRITMQMPNNDYDTNKAVDLVQKTIGKTATVLKSQTYNADNKAAKLNIMVLDIASKDTLDQDQRSKLLTALRTEFKVSENAATNVSSIAPFIGDEIKTKSLYAIFWASFFIILYVWWRFKVMSGLSAGVMAVVALLHDVLIMCAVYFIFKIPLNDSFVAAVLTVIGYSMNDTIIIYDRIRENSNQLRKVPIGELVNKSVVQTLNRSINTVVTVLICIITLYIFAALPGNNITSVKEFTMPLIVGIASGMYSSIFVASSLYVVWKERSGKKKLSGKPAKA